MDLLLMLLSLFEEFDPSWILIQEYSQQHNDDEHDVFNSEDAEEEADAGDTGVLSRQKRKQVVQLVRRISEQYDVGEDWGESHEFKDPDPRSNIVRLLNAGPFHNFFQFEDVSACLEIDEDSWDEGSERECWSE